MASAAQAALREVTSFCGRACVRKEPMSKSHPIETSQEIRGCGGPDFRNPSTIETVPVN